MEEKYRVVFKGEIAPNADPSEVRRKLAALYKTDIKEAERFFSGKRFILKENIDLQTARQYSAQFEEKIGGRCSIFKIEELVPETTPPPQQTDTAADIKQSTPQQPQQPQQEKPPAVYETRYRLMFNGELLIDKDINEVKTNLSILYKVKPEKIEAFFTGKPVKITEPTDFWTAASYMNRFRECGAVCYLETVEPTVRLKAETASSVSPVNPGYGYDSPRARQEAIPAARQEPKQTQPHRPAQTAVPAQAAVPVLPVVAVPAAVPSVSSVPVSAPGEADAEAEHIKSLSLTLYDLLTKTYKQVQQEYRIERKSKEFERGETFMGCLIVFIIGAAVALVIWSPLRWYWGLLGTIGIIAILSPFFQTWDTKYAEAFLKRMDWEKQKNFPMYAATLNKWVQELPATDRGKVFLQEAVEKLLAENQAQKAAYEQYSRLIGVVDVPIEDIETLDQPESNTPTVRTTPKEPRREPRKDPVRCPGCGSTWVSNSVKGFSWGKGIAATVFLGPLAGAIAGGMGEGKPMYHCESCGKKWPRR